MNPIHNLTTPSPHLQYPVLFFTLCWLERELALKANMERTFHRLPS
jgi:hypothetical protein